MQARLGSIIGIVGALILAGLVAAAASSATVGDSQQTLVQLAVLAFAIQWLAFLPAYFFQTEKFYDLVGSLSYITLAVLAVISSSVSNPAGLLIAAMVTIWALRLGSFLFFRILADGRDTRFEKIKPDFLRFLMTWTLQGLWVFVTFAAGLVAITSAQVHSVDGFLIVGTLMWLCGFGIEVIADRQKRQFRQAPENSDRFICEGLWKYSRHPNYFGEILLWIGIAVVALPFMSGWQHVTLVSPLFVYLLLTQVSGVKLLEARARRRWGDDPAYQAYLAQTPVLVFKPWS